MKLSLFKATSRSGARTARLVVTCILAAFALSAATASSASAFGWWIGSPSHPEELTKGTKLLLGTEATVHSPFTLKWLHGYEVKCAGAKYAGLYIEGTVGLGARKISFEECTAKKPKGATVVGGSIETTRLVGEIKPDGSKVEFELKPVGELFASFTLERAITPKVKHKHHREGVRVRNCKIEVSVRGHANGTLGDATTISDEKTFEFDSKALETSQVKTCHRVLPTSDSVRGTARRRHRSSDAKPALTQEEQEAQELKEEEEEEAAELKEEEEEEAAEAAEEQEEVEAIELEEKEEAELEAKKEEKLAEAEACREAEEPAAACKTIEKEAKEIEEVEAERAAEKKKELEELAKEAEERKVEETITGVEGSKGKDSYNGGFAWGV